MKLINKRIVLYNGILFALLQRKPCQLEIKKPSLSALNTRYSVRAISTKFNNQIQERRSKDNKVFVTDLEKNS